MSGKICFDPSASLIKRARDIGKTGIDFLVGKSAVLSKYDDADLIIFHSVLQYFEKEQELDDAISFSEASLRKNSGHLALLDVPDLSRKDEFLEIRKRYKMPDVSEKGELSHSFYDSDILKEKLANSGFRDVQFFPHATKGYGNAYYRFNCLAKL